MREPLGTSNTLYGTIRLIGMYTKV